MRFGFDIIFEQIPYRVVLCCTSTALADFYRHFIARGHFVTQTWTIQVDFRGTLNLPKYICIKISRNSKFTNGEMNFAIIQTQFKNIYLKSLWNSTFLEKMRSFIFLTKLHFQHQCFWLSRIIYILQTIYQKVTLLKNSRLI